MIYTVTSFNDDDGQKMQTKLLMASDKEEVQIYDIYAPRFFLVNFDGPVRALGQVLGMNDEIEATGIVGRLPALFHGYANADMWEWINLQRGDSDD